ncbi:MAG: ArsA family ATPase, partial [Mycobacterium sp.]
ERAIDGTETLKASEADSASTELSAAVLQIHADRGQTAKREVRLLSRFTGANPNVPVIGVPSLPFDVSDLEALRALADQITATG